MVIVVGPGSGHDIVDRWGSVDQVLDQDARPRMIAATGEVLLVVHPRHQLAARMPPARDAKHTNIHANNTHQLL